MYVIFHVLHIISNCHDLAQVAGLAMLLSSKLKRISGIDATNQQHPKKGSRWALPESFYAVLLSVGPGLVPTTLTQSSDTYMKSEGFRPLPSHGGRRRGGLTRLLLVRILQVITIRCSVSSDFRCRQEQAAADFRVQATASSSKLSHRHVQNAHTLCGTQTKRKTILQLDYLPRMCSICKFPCCEDMTRFDTQPPRFVVNKAVAEIPGNCRMPWPFPGNIPVLPIG